MEEGSTLVAIKQCFKKIIPSNDARAKIGPLNFVVTLVFCYLGDSKTQSLESIRRFMKDQLGQELKRNSFWERLSRKRLKNLLGDLVAMLIKELANTINIGGDILLGLGVSGVLVIDSSSISLWDGAKGKYPGTRTTAGIKWHACFDLFSGVMTWFDLTPTSTNDRKCFPDVNSLAKKLIIFDLGYWDYGLLLAIDNAKGFFLSRVKSNSVIFIEGVVQGLSAIHIGKKLSAVNLKRKRGNIIEIAGGILYKKEWVNFRTIGFWNPTEKCYHWYITNLKVGAHLIYPLYRLRWQVELIFKSCKNSLNANRITSNDENIIESLLLASLAAHLTTTSSIVSIGMNQLDDEELLALSFQRIAQVGSVLASHFVSYLINSSKKFMVNLVDRIKLFSNELFDPNYNKRETSLKTVDKLITLGL